MPALLTKVSHRRDWKKSSAELSIRPHDDSDGQGTEIHYSQLIRSLFQFSDLETVGLNLHSGVNHLPLLPSLKVANSVSSSSWCERNPRPRVLTLEHVEEPPAAERASWLHIE